MAQGENGPNIKRPMEKMAQGENSPAPFQVSRSHLKQNAYILHIRASEVI